MPQTIDLKEIERRAKHAAFQDGLIEIFMSVLLVLIGLLLAINKNLVAFSVLLIFILTPALERAKEHFITPRIGYVRFPQDSPREARGILWATAIFVVVILAAWGIFAWVMGANQGFSVWLGYFVPGFTGFMLAFGPFYLGQIYGLWRGYALAALSLLGGIAIPALGIAQGYAAISLLCLILGSIALLMGGIAFSLFLRKNPIPESAHDED